jgi:hypothetical protein
MLLHRKKETRYSELSCASIRRLDAIFVEAGRVLMKLRKKPCEYSLQNMRVCYQQQMQMQEISTTGKSKK